MPIHIDLAPTLEKLDLVVVDLNEGWTVIRRRTFIDLFIGEEPYSSVDVFHHDPSGVSMPTQMQYKSFFVSLVFKLFRRQLSEFLDRLP